jgi:hypothetical protein
LREKDAVMLDLNIYTHHYRLGEWPAAESQGGFWFGRACAARVLKNTIECGYYPGDGVRVRRDATGNLKGVALP